MDALHNSLIRQPDDFNALCAQLEAHDLLGFDTEFVGENTYHPDLCLIQVATPDALYLIDSLELEDLSRFWEIIVDPKRTVVVHAGREEVRLCHLACGRTPANLVDLQLAAGMVGLAYPLGHGPLVQQVLGKRLSKGETLTDWHQRPLTPAQLRYALDDVRYLLATWTKLENKLTQLDRHDWAREEFERLRHIATPLEPNVDSLGEKWRRLKGCGGLDSRRLAAVRELFLWRERKGAELNRPPRVLVRDDLLVEIARRQPKQARDLSVVRGVAHKFLEEMFHALETARGLPNEECPEVVEREVDPPQVAMAVNILQAFLADFAARNYLAPNLIASVSDLRSLTRAQWERDEAPIETLLHTGWRSRAILPELLDVLQGRRWLRLADLRSVTPFEFR